MFFSFPGSFIFLVTALPQLKPLEPAEALLVRQDHGKGAKSPTDARLPGPSTLRD